MLYGALPPSLDRKTLPTGEQVAPMPEPEVELDNQPQEVVDDTQYEWLEVINEETGQILEFEFPKGENPTDEELDDIFNSPEARNAPETPEMYEIRQRKRNLQTPTENILEDISRATRMFGQAAIGIKEMAKGAARELPTALKEHFKHKGMRDLKRDPSVLGLTQEDVAQYEGGQGLSKLEKSIIESGAQNIEDYARIASGAVTQIKELAKYGTHYWSGPKLEEEIQAESERLRSRRWKEKAQQQYGLIFKPEEVYENLKNASSLLTDPGNLVVVSGPGKLAKTGMSIAARKSAYLPRMAAAIPKYSGKSSSWVLESKPIKYLAGKTTEVGKRQGAWQGATVGGTIGATIGGGWGAIVGGQIGAALGHLGGKAVPEFMYSAAKRAARTTEKLGENANQIFKMMTDPGTSKRFFLRVASNPEINPKIRGLAKKAYDMGGTKFGDYAFDTIADGIEIGALNAALEYAATGDVGEAGGAAATGLLGPVTAAFSGSKGGLGSGAGSKRQKNTIAQFIEEGLEKDQVKAFKKLPPEAQIQFASAKLAGNNFKLKILSNQEMVDMFGDKVEAAYDRLDNRTVYINGETATTKKVDELVGNNAHEIGHAAFDSMLNSPEGDNIIAALRLGTTGNKEVVLRDGTKIKGLSNEAVDYISGYNDALGGDVIRTYDDFLHEYSAEHYRLMFEKNPDIFESLDDTGLEFFSSAIRRTLEENGFIKQNGDEIKGAAQRLKRNPEIKKLINNWHQVKKIQDHRAKEEMNNELGYRKITPNEVSKIKTANPNMSIVSHKNAQGENMVGIVPDKKVKKASIKNLKDIAETGGVVPFDLKNKEGNYGIILDRRFIQNLIMSQKGKIEDLSDQLEKYLTTLDNWENSTQMNKLANITMQYIGEDGKLTGFAANRIVAPFGIKLVQKKGGAIGVSLQFTDMHYLRENARLARRDMPEKYLNKDGSLMTVDEIIDDLNTYARDMYKKDSAMPERYKVLYGIKGPDKYVIPIKDTDLKKWAERQMKERTQSKTGYKQREGNARPTGEGNPYNTFKSTYIDGLVGIESIDVPSPSIAYNITKAKFMPKKKISNEVIPKEEGGDMPPATWDYLFANGYNPEDAKGTQITTTKGTYEKIGEKFINKNERILDFSAGLGHGTKALKDKGYNIDGYEPFSQPEKRVIDPDFENVNDIPSNSYDKIINNAVLNVVPEQTRVDILKGIYRVLDNKGEAFVNVMGWNSIKKTLNNPKTKLVGPREVITGKGTFQKGYKQSDFIEFVQKILPEAEVKKGVAGDANVIIKKP